MNNKISNIIVHCSDSRFGCAREIRNWHLQRGWRDIGYHFVILNGQITPDFYLYELDGSIECGRFLDGDSFIKDLEVGAHCLGYNKNSVGICLIGKDSFTPRQFATLTTLLDGMLRKYRLSPVDVLGHYETFSGKSQGKTCPNFNMNSIREILKEVSNGK